MIHTTKPLDLFTLNAGRELVYPCEGRRTLDVAAAVLTGAWSTGEIVLEGSLAFDNWEELRANIRGEPARLNAARTSAGEFHVGPFSWYRVRVGTISAGPAVTNVVRVSLRTR